VRALEIWKLGPEPVKVLDIGGGLLEEYSRRKRELYPGDLGTNWLGRMLAALFKNTPKSLSESFSAVDNTGTNRTVNVKGSISYNITNTTYNYDSGCYIGIGTGTAAPGRNDYALQNEIARAAAGASYIDGSDYVTVTATFTLASSTDITEVGLYWRDGYNGWYILLDRTLLSPPVTFLANTPMLVAYKIYI
jgi:hypothetical protein